MYLVCRFNGYDDERTIALHRVLSAKMTTLSFDRPKDFDFKRFDDEGRFGFGEGKMVKLTFRIAKEEGAHLLETPLSEDQQVKELEGAYQISASVVDSAMLEWWLRGFGDTISGIRRRRVS